MPNKAKADVTIAAPAAAEAAVDFSPVDGRAGASSFTGTDVGVTGLPGVGSVGVVGT